MSPPPTTDLTFRVRGFGPFHDSGEITLRSGPNAFVGLNNSGKTALLYALAALQNGPVESKGSDWQHARGLPETISTYAQGHPNTQISVCQKPGTECARRLSQAITRKTQGKLPQIDSLTFDLRWVNRGITICRLLIGDPDGREHLLLGEPGSTGPSQPIFGAMWPPQLLESLSLSKVTNGAIAKAPEHLELLAWPSQLGRTQLILPQRSVPGPTLPNVEPDLRIHQDATNVPEILHTLNVGSAKRRRIFQDIERRLKEIFPELQSIRPFISRRDGLNQDHLTLETDVRAGEIPMTASGTGVWQILTVLVASFVLDLPALILVDEPGAFLHPAAERQLARLMRELGESRGHIFCLATHSYTLANQCRDRLWGTSTADGSSRATSLAPYRQAAIELGLAPADILPSDAALYVEGPSDAIVVERLLQLAGESRIAVHRLGGNGRLRGSDDLLGLFEALASSLSPFKVPVLALLDRDGRTEEDARRIEARRSIKFLTKPELENYFLDPPSIARALELTDAQAATLADTMARAGPDGKGSEVLRGALRAAATIPYDKVKHLPKIMEVVLATKPGFLAPLQAELSAAAERLRTHSG